MSSSNCCFLTCIHISYEAGKVVWYPQLQKNFPQFVVIHTIKGFGIVNKAKVDVFLELSCFFDDPMDVGNLISGSSAFSKTNLNIWKLTVPVLLRPDLDFASDPLKCFPICGVSMNNCQSNCHASKLMCPSSEAPAECETRTSTCSSCI